MKLLMNFIGRLSGYGECQHCHDTWNWKKEKIIPYKEKGNIDYYQGMFPICEECFNSSSEDEILYHCKLLLQRWIAETGEIELIKNFDIYMDNLKHNIKDMKRN